MDKEEIVFLRKVIKAQDKILMCYKLGGQPPEWCFDMMSKFRELCNNKSNASAKGGCAYSHEKLAQFNNHNYCHYCGVRIRTA